MGATPLPPQPYDPSLATQAILSKARSLGFAAIGIAAARGSSFELELRRWLEAGKHGEMSFMERDLDLRLDPRGHLHDTRSFIVVADQYAARNDAEPALTPLHGRIARYARGRNYHDVMKRRLHRMADEMREEFPGSDFRSFVDTAPVLERELALLAGVGWIAKNTMLIHPRLGSYILLGGAATNLNLAIPAEQLRVADACGSCTRCIEACPTQAITAYSVDARRCISYLSIEHQGEISAELARAVGLNLYGCDICQEVCPHNSPRADGVGVGHPLPQYAPRNAQFDALTVLRWSEQDRREAFRNSAMKRAPLEVMRRNAILVLGTWLREEGARERHAEIRAALISVRDSAAEPAEIRSAASIALGD